MPVILRYKSIKILVFPHDHHPPHIHVVAPGCQAKFLIDPVECVYCRGFKKSFINDMTEYLSEKQQLLLEAWNEFQK